MMTVYTATKNGNKYLFLREATVGSWVVPIYGSVLNADEGFLYTEECSTFNTDIRVADIFYAKMYENMLNKHISSLDTTKLLKGETAAGTFLFYASQVKDGLVYPEEGSMLSILDDEDVSYFSVFACCKANEQDITEYENAVTI